MDVATKITQTIEPSLVSMGYDLVMVRYADGSRRKTLTVMAERSDGVPMGFDDCTEISRMVGALLEVEDPITSAYDLEVCSPGLDRPLTKLKDFTRFMGEEAKVETLMPIDGRKRFRGVIKAVKGNDITILMPEGHDVVLSFPQVRTAKLVVPEAPAKAPKKKHKK